MKKILYSSITALLFAGTMLTSCEDVPMPYDMPTTPAETVPDEPSGSGTLSDPYNTYAALQIISQLDADVETDYMYVKGIISNISEVDTSYGNATYYISDSGKTSNQLYIYRSYYLDNAKFTSASQISVGDEVVIYGKFVNYYGSTPETASGKSYIYSLNGVTSASETGGSTENTSTADNPYTVSQLLPIVSALPSGGTIDNVYVKGIVSEITEISPSYGNMTYYISDDGTTSNQLLIYRGKSLNNASPSSTSEIKIGDEVVVYGQFVNYYGNTPEGAQGATYIYSLNGNTSDTGGSTENTSTADNPYTVSQLIPMISVLASGGTIDNVYVKGIVSQIDEISTSFGNATYYISDDGTTANQLCIYRGYSLGNAKFTSSDEIKIGDVVIVYGQFVNYYGNTPEGATGATYIYSLNGITGSTGSETSGTSGGVSISGTTVTLTNSAATAGSTTAYINLDVGLDNATSVDGQSFSFDDGSTVTFAKNGGSTAPTYYTATKGIRVYAMNTLTFSTTKTIANIVMTCDVYNGTNEVGNETATVAFSDTGAVYCNYFTSNSGGTQLRVQTITITYAE